jgi:1,4-dihydroxy-2-naphthoate octaprenyltransferase
MAKFKYQYNNYTAFIIAFAVTLLMHANFSFYTHAPATIQIYALVFTFTYLAYSSFQQHFYTLNKIWLACALLGYILMCTFCFKHPLAILIMLLVVFLVYAYLRPQKKNTHSFRNIPFSKTITLALVWSLVTVAIPATYNIYVTTTAIAISFIRRIFFLAALSIPFDVRDELSDTDNYRFNIVNYLGRLKAWYLCMCLILLNIISLFLLFGLPADGYITVLYLLSIAAAIPCYGYFKNQNSWYLLCIDGCLLAEALLFWAIYTSQHSFIL